MTLLKKGHFSENMTRYYTTLNLYDPRFSGHIEFFQRSHELNAMGSPMHIAKIDGDLLAECQQVFLRGVHGHHALFQLADGQDILDKVVHLPNLSLYWALLNE